MQSNYTRFRAYQLGNEGSSFSYCDGTTFTLIEARLTEQSKPSLDYELKLYGKTEINRLHITSWDTDHCKQDELLTILNTYKPKQIEMPGYEPHTDSGKNCKALIEKYKALLSQHNISSTINQMTPQYINELSHASSFGSNNVIFHPRKLWSTSNDNSTIKLFRSGRFDVLSLGDVESPEIAKNLIGSSIIDETDVMILAHHGADNGFTTDELIKKIKPRVAICTSNYDNQYSHPRQEIRDLLFQNGVDLYTTKTGDVLIRSIESPNGDYQVINMKANNEEISSHKIYKSKLWEKMNSK